MEHLLNQSQNSETVIGLHRMQPSMSHLYRFMWQWGVDDDGFVAYDQMQIQKYSAINDCAIYNLRLKYHTDG